MTNEATENTPEEEFNLDQVVSDAYDKTTLPDTSEEKPIENKEVPEEQIKDIETKDGVSIEKDKPADKQPLEPHSRWSTVDKEAFKALPREAQEIVLKRESEIEKTLTQKTQEIAEQRKIYDSLDSVIAPRRHSFVNEGGEVAVIDQLLQIRDYMRSDPAACIKWLAEQNGVDFGADKSVPAGDEIKDPALLAQQRRIDVLEQERNQEKQMAQSARRETIQKEITNFETEKDADGNLKRPHVNEVRAEMAALFKANIVNNLQDAYDRAIYTNPATRSKILEEVTKSNEKARIDAAKAAASKAEKAVGVKIKTKTPASTGVTGGNWEDDLSNIVDAVFSA